DDFEYWELVGEYDSSLLESFTWQGTDIGSCEIQATLPLPLQSDEHIEVALLDVRVELGEPERNGGFDETILSLELRSTHHVVQANGKSGWFEDDLLEIQRQLPPPMYMRACITCAYSDYHPVGHGMFGGMACFRDNKSGYSTVRSKADIFQVWDTRTEFVQETHCCSEFERRTPGTGYRG
ncbi:MAG: DUF6304 family protein, partial [Planctomycetales bacterium]